MKLFSLFRGRRRRPEWTYSAGAPIWRVMISPSGRIVGESRDQEKKLASFFCLNGETGSPLWQDVRLAEPWWVGIEGLHGDLVLMHEFAKPDLPQHRGIVALEVETGKERWRNEELSFWFAHGDRMYAYRDLFEHRIAYALSISTGEVVESFEEGIESLSLLRRRAADQRGDDRVIVPETLTASADPAVAAFVADRIGRQKPVGEVEFVREGGIVVFSYYRHARASTEEEPVLENELVVVDAGRGREEFSEVLVGDARAPVPDTFFVKRPFLYFIKNKSMIAALRLWKS